MPYIGSGSSDRNGFIVTNQFTTNQFTPKKCIVRSTISYRRNIDDDLNASQFNTIGNIHLSDLQFQITCENRPCEGIYSGTVTKSSITSENGFIE